MASRRTIGLIAALAVLVLAIVWVVQTRPTAPAGSLSVAGDVRSDVHAITAPSISYPTPDYTVGIASPASQSKPKTPASSQAMARSILPVVSGTLTEVRVRTGDTVKKGEVVAQLDTTMLDLQVRAARAAAARAHSDVSLMKDNLDTISDNRSKLADAKTKLADAQTKLADARTQLLTARDQLLKTRKQLIATRAKAVAGRRQIIIQIRRLQDIISHLPSTPPTSTTGTPPPTPQPDPRKVLAALRVKFGQINAGIAKIDSGLAKVNAGLVKVNAGLAKVDTGANKLAAAKDKLATGADALNTAEEQVNHAKDLLGVVAQGKDLGIQVAEIKRDQATIKSPVEGSVTFARTAGTVVMVGAPIVRVRPNSPTQVDTYLTAEQVALVGIGSRTSVTCDSLPGQVFVGRISRIGTNYDFPPTSFPTEIVHMTRAVRVTATIESGSIPAGTPVDIRIDTNRNR